jgi:hypothetical protein
MEATSGKVSFGKTGKHLIMKSPGGLQNCPWELHFAHTDPPRMERAIPNGHGVPQESSVTLGEGCCRGCSDLAFSLNNYQTISCLSLSISILR